MQVWRAAIAVLAVVMLAAPAGWAQSLSSVDGPAEQPPASFKGRQFVDSTGCIFVRAGYDGAVTWVPRVTRDKKVICGYKPTFGQAAAAAPAPQPKAPEITIAAPAAPAPTPKPKVEVAAPAPAPQGPSPARVAEAKRAACPQLGASATRYMVVVDGYKFRCDPQPAGESVAVASVEEMGTKSYAPPKGYKQAWTDGRLNPMRGPRTAAGNAQMERLYDTSKLPMVERTGKQLRVVPRTGEVVSTKNEPGTPLASKGWVQVASFSEVDNARRTAVRLIDMGLPAAISKVTRGGKPVQIVLAGPFATSEDLKRGLTLARRAGFRDAFAR